MIDTLLYQRYGEVPECIYTVNLPAKTSDELPAMIFPVHIQNSIEILCSIKGNLKIDVGTQSYTLTPGDIVIIPPYERHVGYIAAPDEDTSYYCIVADLKFFTRSLGKTAAKCLHSVINRKAHFREFIPANDKYAELIRNRIPLLIELYDQHNTIAETRLTAHMVMLLADLIEYYYCYDTSNTNKNIEFIRMTIDYIDRYYNWDISTISICEALSYSKEYFSRQFKKNFGMNFGEYLNRYRVERAISWNYLESGLSLNELAARSGFNDYASFTRSFKRYTGQNPKEYLAGAPRQA